MSGFSENRTPLLLQELGFTDVSPMRGGVYHIKSNSAESTTATEYIALLCAPAPITAETKCAQLFMLPIPAPLRPDLTPLQMQTHWQNLDARRLEESGIDPITVHLRADEQWDRLPTAEYARPGQTGRVRYCVQLPTGDVVCYN